MLGLLRKPKEVDQFKLAQAAERGDRAERLARDEAFTDALREVEAVYMEAWRAASPLDTEVRERAWVAVKLLDDIRGQIVATVREGVAARKQIERALHQ